MGLQGTGEVVGVGAAQTVAATRGAGLLAVSTAQRQASSQSQLHVDQGTGLSLVHLAGPKGTVQVHLRHKYKRQQVNHPLQTGFRNSPEQKAAYSPTGPGPGSRVGPVHLSVRLPAGDRSSTSAGLWVTGLDEDTSPASSTTHQLHPLLVRQPPR